MIIPSLQPRHNLRRPRGRQNNRDLKHRQRNGRRRFATEADWAKGFVFGGENEVARYSFSRPIPPKFEHKLRRHKQSFGKIATTVVLDKDENLFWSGLQWHRSCHSNEMTLLRILLIYTYVLATTANLPEFRRRRRLDDVLITLRMPRRFARENFTSGRRRRTISLSMLGPNEIFVTEFEKRNILSRRGLKAQDRKPFSIHKFSIPSRNLYKAIKCDVFS